MNWITLLLLFLGLLVLARIIYLLRKPSQPEKRTIRLQEPPPRRTSGDAVPGYLLILLLFLMAAAVAVQIFLNVMR